jgi:hypothetical protein
VRLAFRALIYLALPSVAFAWLLEVDVPAPVWRSDGWFHEWALDAIGHLTEAAGYVALGAGVVAVLVALGLLFSTDVGPQPGRRSKR